MDHLPREIDLFRKNGDIFSPETFRIVSDNIRQGSTARCFEVERILASEGILKEFYPIEEEYKMKEDEKESRKGILDLSQTRNQEKARERFREDKETFVRRYENLRTELRGIVPAYAIYYGADENKDQLHTVYVFSDKVITYKEIVKELYEKKKNVPAEKRLMLILNALTELTSAIAILHKRGYIHCDIKPSNFGFTSLKGDDNVGDISLFDIDSICPLFTENQFKSTPAYADPWVDVFSTQSDIYSIGCVLKYSLFYADKEPNVQKENTIDTLNEFLNDLEDLLPKTTLIRELANPEAFIDKIADIIWCSLCEPASRYANCQLLLKDLVDAKDILNNISKEKGKPEELPDGSETEHKQQNNPIVTPKREKPWRLILSALLILVVLSGVVLVWRSSRKQTPSDNEVPINVSETNTSSENRTSAQLDEEMRKNLSSETLNEILKKEAKQLKSEDRTEEAIKKYETIITKENATAEDKAEACLELGDIYYHDESKTPEERMTKAIEYFDDALGYGNVEGAYRAAYILLFDSKKPIADRAYTAKALFEKAAAQNHAKAQYYLAYMYENDLPKGEGDQNQANKYLQMSVENGYEYAMYITGIRNEEGSYGMPQDISSAIDWYTKAAEKGCADAYTRLGLLYHNGQYIARDEKKAMEYFNLAIENKAENQNDARNYLANIYWKGEDGIPKDQIKAAKLWEEGFEKGSIESLLQLCSLYHKIWPDEQKTLEYIVKASNNPELWENAAREKRYSEIRDLGWLFYNIYDYISRDYYSEYEDLINRHQDLAMSCWSAAADEGSADCMRLVGDLYQDKDYNGRNGTEAINWWKKASEEKKYKWWLKAEPGNYRAMRALGQIYYGDDEYYTYQEFVKDNEGEDVTLQDYQEKLELYYYDEVYGIRLDNQKSLEWYTMAAEAGDYISMARLIYMYSGKVYNVEADPEKVQYWTDKLKTTIPPANICLLLGKEYLGRLYTDAGIMLFKGPYEEVMKEEAIFWLEKSAEGGNSEASKLLEELNVTTKPANE